MSKFFVRPKRRPLITVSVREDVGEVFPEPYLSIDRIPQEYKDIPNTPDDGGELGLRNRTVKNCMPFFDAMSSGIVIPMPYDLRIISENGGSSVKYFWSAMPEEDFSMNSPLVSFHPRWQVGDMTERPILKIDTPYHVDTPKGWSVMFTEPLNRFYNFRVISGIVDTDVYNSQINCFIQWWGPDGDFTISAGEPLMVLHPIPRVRQKLVYNKISYKEWQVRDQLRKRSVAIRAAYKKLSRQPRLREQ